MANYLINPWLEIQNMKEEIGRIMENTLSGGYVSRDSRMAHFQPAADVYETTQALVIQLEMPGMDREAVAVEVKDRVLWVYGERRMEKDASGSDYHLLERSYGPFARRFFLPEGADVDKVSATLEKGILTISIPKIGQNRQAGRRISITQE